ncbi:MAG: hypothetical protein V4608_14760 [Bacteroidota bacterium]
MADEKLVKATNKDFVPAEGIIDITKRVKLIATEKAPYHEDGEEFEASTVLAESFLKLGFATKA